MCGLTGFWGISTDAQVMHSHLKSMTQHIHHRGPDSDGQWVDAVAGIGLGHRRLAIVDLSPAGAQPMQAVSGRWAIAFNGEIYNHLQLRAELEKTSLAPVWRGHSDTETLLAGFDAWGIRVTIEKCVGMFAMAVWCRQTQSLTLVRDRLGEKPLYYGWQGQGSQAVFLFGSELKALCAHPAFAAEIDRQALGSYMQNMAVAGTRSIYKGIHKVPPGTILMLCREHPDLVVTRYWSLENVAALGVANHFTGSATQAVDALEALLKEAVAQQMIADVPLGAFLSGGVDSSTIVALMHKQSPRPVKTFSIGFHEQAYNEAEHAKAVASYLGTEHTDLYVTAEQAMDLIPRLPSMYDEPFADSSQIPTFLVSQMTAQQVKVALSGDAGDELFAGYDRYQLTASLWPKLASMPQPLRKLVAWGLTRFSPDMLNHWASHTPLAKRWSGVGDKIHKGAGIMGAGSVAELYQGMVAMGWSQPSALVRGMDGDAITLNMPDLPGLNNVQRMMAFDLLNYLPDDILTKVDRAAMAVSLETRVPFLDHRVVEFAWRLPMDFKLGRENGRSVTKWALRQVLYRHVPKELIERPKAGFGMPLEHWLRGPLRDWAEDLLSEARINRDGFLNPEPVRQRWKEHLSGKRNWQHSIWCVLMFQAWLDEQKRSVGAA